MVSPHKSTIGLDANIWVLLLFIITIILSFIPGVQFVAWLLPLIFFLIEKNSDFVKYYAMQMVALYIINAIIDIVLSIIGFAISLSAVASIGSLNFFGAYSGFIGAAVMSIITVVVAVLFAVLAIVAMIKAYNYTIYEMPVVGKFAEKLRGLGKK